VIYDPDPDEREEARGILSVSLAQLAQLYANLSGNLEGFPDIPEAEVEKPETAGGTEEGPGHGSETGELGAMRADAEEAYRSAPLPPYFPEDRRDLLTRALWEQPGLPAETGEAGEYPAPLKERIAYLATLAAELLEPEGRSDEELMAAAREVEILSVLEISPRLSHANAALQIENTEIFRRLTVLGAVSVLAILVAVTGGLFGILLPMERHVSAAQEDLEHANSELERTVAVRTAELEDSNRRLRSEIVERQDIEAALRESEARFRNLFDSAPIAIREEDFSQVIAAIDELGMEDNDRLADYLDAHPEFVRKCADLIVFTDANMAAVRLHGLEDKSEFLSSITTNLSSSAFESLKSALIAVHRRETHLEFETSVVPANGEKRIIMAHWSVAEGHEKTYSRILLSSVDVTQHRQAEERLKQAQKMEAVGQLTGGVAHDFNNLLAVIRGNVELLADSPDVDPACTEQILRAVSRSADLTQRLLAFSRQQPLRPRAIRLAELVSGMSDLLTRTLGETIEFGTKVAPNLWSAMADPGQVENALLNLALNARDAMPKGGNLTVECSNVQFDRAYLAGPSDVPPGDYVVLSVSDDGTGMSDAVRARAFEPFFTTKEVGQGSGLGLSMVYGFAKQSGGHVSIYSELGKGTTVRLYLPRTPEAETRTGAEKTSNSLPRGQGETILVIEDDTEVRSLAVQMLSSLGYQSKAVADASQAHEVLADGAGIDLVLSDVVLPGGTSGADFAEQACSIYPGIKIIFMSGYPAEAATRNGFIDSDSVLLGKPFERRQLAEALRQALS